MFCVREFKKSIIKQKKKRLNILHQHDLNEHIFVQEYTPHDTRHI